MPQSYNIKFNKSLFRKHVISGFWTWIIGSLLSFVLVVLMLLASFQWNWPMWLLVLALIAFLYFFVAGLWTTCSDYLEYRRIHGKPKET